MTDSDREGAAWTIGQLARTLAKRDGRDPEEAERAAMLDYYREQYGEERAVATSMRAAAAIEGADLDAAERAAMLTYYRHRASGISRVEAERKARRVAVRTGVAR